MYGNHNYYRSSFLKFITKIPFCNRLDKFVDQNNPPLVVCEGRGLPNIVGVKHQGEFYENMVKNCRSKLF